MKRLFTLSAICIAAMSLVGCSDYSHQARVWICDQVDHFACPDGDRHSLYYFEDHSYLRMAPYSFTKVDLDEMTSSEVRSVTCSDNSTYGFLGLQSIGLPEDKGYDGSEEFVIAIKDDKLPRGEREVGIVYNTYDEPHRKICQGTYVRAHGFSLVSCAQVTGGSISSVDVYDVEDGKKLQTKTYMGNIARQDIMAEIVERDGYIAGSYYYTKYGPGKHRIYIYGEVDEERNFHIEGFNGDDYNCEDWIGTFKDGQFTAKAYINFNNREYDFILTEVK